MKIEICSNADAAAHQAATLIAEHAHEAVGRRGKFLLALSGGQTAKLLLKELEAQDLPWAQTHVVQVDERVAPAGSPDRNLTNLQQTLVARGKLPISQLHCMPVNAKDLSAATWQYAETLEQLGGSPPVLDLVHLGLGADGHTASLVPDDPVLEITNTDVALTNPYQGLRRMTLTYPIINRSRHILWLVSGAQKAPALARLCRSDASIPAARINGKSAVIFADQATDAHLLAHAPH